MEKGNNQPAWSKVAEIEICYKSKIRPSERPTVQSSIDIYRLLLQIWDEDTIEIQEHFKVLFLNRAHKILGVYHASKGGITGTVADPRLILAAALKSVACSIVLAHNHPSGNLKPSISDIDLTQKITNGCKFIDITVLDHLIISSEGYFSMADEGLIN